VEIIGHTRKTRLFTRFSTKKPANLLGKLLLYIEAAAVPLGFSTKKTPHLGGVRGSLGSPFWFEIIYLFVF
jgi:hypothetical protein